MPSLGYLPPPPRAPPPTAPQTPSARLSQGYEAILQSLRQRCEVTHSSHSGAEFHPCSGGCSAARAPQRLLVAAPQFLGSGGGRVRNPLFLLLFLLGADLRAQAGGWCVLARRESQHPRSPAAGRVCYVSNGKNPTTTPHLFSPRSNLPQLPALQTSPLQANASPRGHSVTPAPRPFPPSHRLFGSCAFISTQLPGGQKRRASLRAQRSRCCGRGCQGKA